MAGAIANANDPLTKAKKRTYEGFTRLVLWGSVCVASLTALVILIITR
jgi:Bacterial aa3 type cytochrome c oxidase subunit IV